ncbi:2-methylisocitrate lyase-like PEP mutase family enzyme [Kitasatospora gansuensis]|uniref:2-methylisocitrate lyase-like PEP mutase family enzyme n=1 Tax=Kitasatospora gansuensis TaxID=258050 RepID=A0A7W7WHY1_9ACTN|nr:isocitrate lyase/phosphoenolpyruvate mutase family protein [Kitasatospora gansuensis]MBB4947638.1 2-methylisocitrate lyase-like PEP mutase family enzyme [Kitasatospora gansuensis]
MTTTQQAKAELLHALHVPGKPLVLANVWDAATARLVAAAGAPAVATASASVSWTRGVADGGGLDLAGSLAQTELVVRSVDVPVTADLEDGLAEDAPGVGRTVTELLALGAVGMNLEDSRAAGLRPVAEAAERVAAARAAADAAGIRLYLNARTDVFLFGTGAVEDAIERARAYLAAGADGIFVPGPTDPAVITELLAALPGVRLNVGGGAGAPNVADMARLGVARISLGPGLARVAYAAVRRAAEEVYGSGSYDSLTGGLEYGELNALFD